jgi:carboxyl-terminal processing protease
MQDWDQALIVGQTSFGKGTVQTVFNLSETEAIKLTTAKYYTPSGRSIHRDRSRESEEGEGEDPLPEETNDGGVDATPQMNDLKENDNVEVPEEDAEIYYTASGRIVYGGGGITPDVVFAPEYYTDLQRRLEANAFAFSFAVDAFKDREVGEDFETSDEILDEFYAFVESKEFEYDAEELTEENVDYIRTMIAREVVNNKFGRKAMYRVLLDSDKEFQKVLSMMRDAPTLKELFVFAEEQKAIKKASID